MLPSLKRTMHPEHYPPGPMRVLTEACMQTQAHPLEPFFQQAVRDSYEGKLGLHDPDVIAYVSRVLCDFSEANSLFKARDVEYIRLEGCPVSVTEQVLALSTLVGSKNPILGASDSVRFNKAYLAWRAATAGQRLLGQPYQKPGACPRGQAMPVLESPHDAEE